MNRVYFLVTLVLVSCQSGTSDRIVIPDNMSVSGQGLLTHIMEESANHPDNERLLRQELFYCEQLGWPAPCNQTLLRAKRRWGFNEKLIDQMVAYHLKHSNSDQMETVLKGAIETRPRLEAKIKIATHKNQNPQNLIQRYLDQYLDKKATTFVLNQYLELGDTSKAITQFEQLVLLDDGHPLLRTYYPMLVKKKRYAESARIIVNQLRESKEDTLLLFDLAVSTYQMGLLDSAKTILKKNDGKRSNQMLAQWFRSEQNWDSALRYLDKLLVLNQDDRAVLLAKAETLESKKWITPSLPFYERVLLLDTTDTEMAKRVDIVRRKVAYLRRIKEQKKLRPLLNLERKTSTDN